MRRSSVDRRRCQRYDIDGELMATLTTAQLLRIVDIGQSGVLVQTCAPLSVHSVYEGRIVAGGEEFDVRFRVLHVRRSDEESTHYLMGVEFLGLSLRVSARDCQLRVLVRVSVMVRDIAQGGALLEAPVEVPLASQAHLRTMLRGRRFETDLDVGRSDADTRSGASGSRLGVRFTTMDAESRSALTDFLAIATEQSN